MIFNRVLNDLKNGLNPTSDLLHEITANKVYSARNFIIIEVIEDNINFVKSLGILVRIER